ncbi:hypothetical protein DMX09_17385 [Pseudomonas protegens]|uniref:Uncharacterized protein n=2 Tax=Pseudomonas TaxID=286 RepID=A0A9Q6IBS6_9PSED|nr:hypothetical protein [Pseudomonas sp. WS 5414]PYC02837.1 hypothetical protein DMX09_17385 [Pseudomonas protegens]PYC31909.1 hypothetical protein DMX08_23340 [Pseudomonas protegens]ROL89073.1 hypothetical protein BK639_27005 [Pseudomonas protegens]ROM00764.1 hypothetical protein BK640_16685 [Pseudomonas protegens]
MESAMNIFQRTLLLIKVLVMLSLGTSAAWAHNLLEVKEPGFSSTIGEPEQMLAQSESEPGDEGQGGSSGDDDQTTDDDDEGDSQS